MMIRKILAAALLAVGLPTPALAAQPTFVVGSPPPITQLFVSATATVSGNPDMATLGFTIQTHDNRSAASAMSDNNAIYQRFAAQAISSGISSQSLRTTFFNVTFSPPAPAGAPVRDYGYTVTRGVSAEIHKLDLVGKIIDNAVDAGVNNVNSVTFGISDNHPLLMRALADAVAQARASAETMARAAGIRLVRIHTISQGYTTFPTPMAAIGSLRTIANVTVPTTIQPTSISVQASVSITYDIR